MGATGTGSIKPLVCSLLFMNEQREGEEGAISTSARERARAKARLLHGTGVTYSGAASCRDRQALPSCLSPAQPPSTARGHVVLACSGLDGLQGTLGCPQGDEKVLGSFWAAHSTPITSVADGGARPRAAHRRLPSPSQPHVPCGRE